MASSWRTLLISLTDLSRIEKTRAFHALHLLRWSEEEINKYFQEALKVGDGFLSDLLRQLPATTGAALSGDSNPKTVTVFSDTADDDDDDPASQKRIFKFADEADFKWFMSANAGSFMLFTKVDGDRVGVTSYRQLEDGGSYLWDMPLSRRVKSLERYIANEAMACEEEFAQSMLNELKRNKLAVNPVVRSDLRRHCMGMSTEQEFDAVIMEGGDRAFLGSVKHTGRGTSFISRFTSEVKKVVERREDPQQFPSYAEFRGGMLGCCLRVDCVQEKASQDILHFCHRNGIGLFCRSGGALGMVVHPRSYGHTQTIGNGFLNLALTRGLSVMSKLLSEGLLLVSRSVRAAASSCWWLKLNHKLGCCILHLDTMACHTD